MWRSLFCVFMCYLLNYVSGFSQLCGNRTEKTLSCTTQISGQDFADYDMCKMQVYPPNSEECGKMNFGDFAPNTYIGGVTLKPYIMRELHQGKSLLNFTINRTVLNITFSNIKWKTMKFRFQDKHGNMRNHCRSIVLSNNVTIDDKSVLYYDCYWPKTDERDGQTHILDFEASDDRIVNRGQYYFNIPSVQMLSPTVTVDQWKPFIYIEIFPKKMTLHVTPPPFHIKINDYHISVMKECGHQMCEVQSTTIKLMNYTDDVTYDYNILGENGTFNFAVSPRHDKCISGNYCKVVESPKLKISSVHESLNVCIVSVMALILSALVAYLLFVQFIRKYWCKDYNSLGMGSPTKILAIYSSSNRIHAQCVASFVTYLRSEYGFDVVYDGDILSTTADSDPLTWADRAFREATHLMYIVGPPEEANYSAYNQPIITPHKNLDALLLSFLLANRVSKCPKQIFNVSFEYSSGELPKETRHDKVFHMMKDRKKLIAYLSKNMLPSKQIMRTGREKCFLEDLTKAKQILSARQDEVFIKGEKINAFEKKILV